MAAGTVLKEHAREKAKARLYGLLELQKKVKRQFGSEGYDTSGFRQTE